MFADDFELVTTSQQPVWNRSYVQCPCDWTRVGIRYNLIYPTSQGEHMVLITLKLYVFKYMPIAEYVVFTFLTGCIRRMNFHPNSNCFCQFKSLHQKHLRKQCVVSWLYIFCLFFNIIHFENNNKSIWQLKIVTRAL